MPDSGSSPRVAKKRRARRELIAEAAMAAIAEHGPAEFSLNQLARELDYTPGALYWYFPSKEALVAEVQRRVLTELAETIGREREVWKRAPSVAGAAPAVRILYALLRQSQHYLRLEETSWAQARIISFSVDPRILHDEAHSTLLQPVLVELIRVSAAGFYEAAELGALEQGNPAQRAVLYWANNQGAVQTAKLARFQPELFNAETLGLTGARALLRGWGAPEDAIEFALKCVLADTAR